MEFDKLFAVIWRDAGRRAAGAKAPAQFMKVRSPLQGASRSGLCLAASAWNRLPADFHVL